VKRKKCAQKEFDRADIVRDVRYNVLPMSQAAHHQYIRGDSHFSSFGEYASKSRFANYLPTLGLAGWPYTQGIPRGRSRCNQPGRGLILQNDSTRTKG
jgi:hypothetical protein